MAISKELLLSLLSMDAYNRGYGAELNNLSDVPDTLIGTVKVLKTINEAPDPFKAEAENAGFYAVAYDVPGLGTVISYRGTDEELKDAWNGWSSIVGGVPEQARLAAQFYNSVRKDLDEHANIILTGHSLGGALAGFVGRLHGEEAVLFDNIAFEAAADHVSQAAIDAYADIETQVAASGGTEAEKELLKQQLLDDQQSVIGDYYGDKEPATVDSSNITALAVPGEVAELARSLQSETIVGAVGSQSASQNISAVPDLDEYVGYLAAVAGQLNTAKAKINLHSQNFLAIKLYAEQYGQDPLWGIVYNETVRALYSKGVAESAGILKDGAGNHGHLRDMIAYSILDSGERIFGDAGIRTMFNDIRDLGVVYHPSFDGLRNGFLEDDIDDTGFIDLQFDTTVKQALSNMVVQYAGALALNAIKRSDVSFLDVEQGILSRDSSSTTLALDLSSVLWEDVLKVSDSSANAVNPIHREAFLEEYFQQSNALAGFWQRFFGGFDTARLDQLAQDIWSGTDRSIFDRLHMKTLASPDSDTSVSVTLSDRNYPSQGVNGNEVHVDVYVGDQEHDNIVQTSNGDDLIIGGDGNDRFIDLLRLYGGTDSSNANDVYIGGAGENPNEQDVVEYSIRTDLNDEDTVGENGLEVEYVKFAKFGDDEAAFISVHEKGEVPAGMDWLFNIDRVELSERSDRFAALEGWRNSLEGTPNFDLLISGGDEAIESLDNAELGDVLDFSNESSAVYLASSVIGSGDEARQVTEAFGGYEQMSQFVQFILLTIIPRGEPQGKGIYDPLGLQFSDFEHVIGSDHDDILSLRDLNPGGTLTAEQQQQIDEAEVLGGAVDGSDPVAAGAAFDARMEAARLVPQNQQDVLIQGGRGDDFIAGPNTGFARLEGGAGNDVLRAGEFVSVLYGDEGDDTLSGGGLKSLLYGGEGNDIFNLSNHSFAMDATRDDYLMWGNHVLAGGVEQWWMESGWAYWTPWSSILLTMPLPNLAGLASVAAAVLDAPMMTAFRYALTSSDQLIVQTGLGRGGQAVVENYSLDLENGKATGHVVVFKQIWGDPSIEGYRNYIKLALQAGFGITFDGTDPLIIDLDKDGIELTSLDLGAYFDLDGDGFAEKSNWVEGDDGFLARDLNDDGEISDISELFGNANTSGFLHLADYDSNSDGVINSLDTNFSDLLIWRDLDGDGKSIAGELQSLFAAGISEISLATTTPTQTDIRGNEIRAESTVTFSDGSTTRIADVLLNNDQVDSIYLGDSTISSQAGQHANLKGYGDMVDLQVAMTNDAALLAAVSSFENLSSDSSWQVLQSETADIMFRWAGVENTSPTQMGSGTFDQQKLAFLEQFFGRQMTPRDGNGVPDETNIDVLIESWNDALDMATIRLAIQGPLSSVFSEVNFDFTKDRLNSANNDTLVSAYKAAISQLPGNQDDALIEWNGKWSPLFSVIAENLRRADGFDVKDDYVVQSLVKTLSTTSSPLSLEQLVNGLGIEGVVFGTSSSDNLTRDASGGLRVYLPEAGDDTITGGAGQDVYVFTEGFGQDVVVDQERGESGDRIRFATLSKDDVTISKSGTDLVISVNGANDSITIVGTFDTPVLDLFGMPISAQKGVEEIQFSDGTVMDFHNISAAVGLGTDNAETIEGSGRTDHIEGLKGDDILKGGDSGDVYYYSKGDGHDIIHDIIQDPLLRGADVLILADAIGMEDYYFTRDGASDDLMINFDWSGDSITVVDQFAYDYRGFDTEFATDSRIEIINMVNGIGYNWNDIQGALISSYTTSGDDITYGFGTSDVFNSSSGDDQLVGFDGGDTYQFGIGSGNDVIHDQSQYPETFVAGLIGQSWGANDVVEFGEGVRLADVTFSRLSGTTDLLISIAGQSDTLTVVDQFSGQKLDAFNLLGIAWFDRVEEFKFQDGTVLSAADVIDVVTTGDEFDNSLSGTILGDRLDGKGGNDDLSGGEGGDTYLFDRGYGNDIVEDGRLNPFITENDIIEFGTGLTVSDVVFERLGDTEDLLISISDTSDTLLLKGQYELLFSGAFEPYGKNNIEVFRWGDGTEKSWIDLSAEILSAAQTAGNDTVIGTYNSDTIDAGAGDDLLVGSEGEDIYQYNLGDGNDIIEDRAYNILSGSLDVLEFGSGITTADVQISRDTSRGTEDIVLSIAQTGETVTLSQQAEYTTINYRPNQIEEVRFEDGTVWLDADLKRLYLETNSTAGDDQLRGFETDDLLNGGAGDDLLAGGDGSDVYEFGIGSGNDTIQESVGYVTYADDDVVRFVTGLTEADVSFSIGDTHEDLVVTLNASGETLTIIGQNATSSFFTWNDIETFEFSDGTSLSKAEIIERLISQQVTQGDDQISGFYTDDVLDGGTGNDRLMGGNGDDVYRFGFGSGDDIIHDYDEAYFEGSADVVEFGAGVGLSDISVSQSGEDLVITLANSGERLTIKGNLGSNTYLYIEEYRFADGTTLDRAQMAQLVGGFSAIFGDENDNVIDTTSLDDTVIGGLGNDTINSEDGNDTFVYSKGDGNDVVREDSDSSSYTDRFVFTDINPEEVVLSREGTDLFVDVIDTGHRIEIKWQFWSTTSYYGIEEFEFADGTVWDRTQIQQRAYYRGDDGDNSISTSSLDDTVVGGKGDDSIDSRAGSDTFLYAKGDGSDFIDEEDSSTTYVDRFVFTDLNPEEVQFSRNGVDLFLHVLGTGDSIEIDEHFWSTSANYGIEEVEFADGTIWDRTQIQQRAYYRGDDGDNSISTSSLDDTVVGGKGDDSIDSRAGSDTFLYAKGDGSDFIDEEDSSTTYVDRFVFTDLNPEEVQFSRNGVDLFLHVLGTGDSIEIDEHFWSTSANYGIEEVEFADGTIWDRTQIQQRAYYRGDDGDNSISTSSLDDTVVGGKGDDSIDSRAGSDTFLYAKGDGSDFIDEEDSSTTYVDRFVFTDLNPEEVQFSRNGVDLFLHVLGTGDSIEIDEHFWSTSANYGIEEVEFADGSVYHRDNFLFGDTGNDLLEGDGSDGLVNGGAGNDTLFGYGGNDILIGGVGADSLQGGDGDDIVHVDDDDTWFAGDAGIDTFIYDGASDVQYTLDTGAFENAILNIGNDTIWGSDSANTIKGGDGNDTLFGYGGDDTLVGGVGVDSLQGGDGDDIIYVDETDSWFSGDDGIDTVVFEGTADIQYALDQGAFENAELGGGDDTIWGGDTNNMIDGGDGDDTLFGYGGNDILIGGAGSDSLQGGDGNDTIHVDETDSWFSGDDGIDTVVYEGTSNIQYALDQGSFENATLGSGNDTIWATDGDNILNMGAGDDVAYGYDGNDIFNGGAGDDLLVLSGTGSDTVKYVSGNDIDRVQSFQASGSTTSNHTIEVDVDGVADFDDLLALASQSGDDTLVDFGGGDQLIIEDVQVANLDRDAFSFV